METESDECHTRSTGLGHLQYTNDISTANNTREELGREENETDARKVEIKENTRK
jgi:hypothetical protein